MECQLTKSTRRHLPLGIIGIVLILGGCATGQESQVPDDCMTANCLVQKGIAPEWIIKPEIYGDDGKNVIYGVGMASNISNPSLLRRSAESQARRQIAEFWKTNIEGLLTGYSGSISEGVVGQDTGEQDVQDILRQLTKQTLQGVSIAEYWENPYGREMYSLARLDLERFDQVLTRLASVKGTSEELAKIIRQNKKEFESKLDGLLKKEGH